MVRWGFESLYSDMDDIVFGIMAGAIVSIVLIFILELTVFRNFDFQGSIGVNNCSSEYGLIGEEILLLDEDEDVIESSPLTLEEPGRYCVYGFKFEDIDPGINGEFGLKIRDHLKWYTQEQLEEGIIITLGEK